jgi:NTP pyrophosphatase (non-canonical NTP hydrolase)
MTNYDEISQISQICYTEAARRGFYDKIKSRSVEQLLKEENAEELLRFLACLAGIDSEVAEVRDALRKDNKEAVSEHVSEEMADIVINTLSICGLMNIDIGEAVRLKLIANQKRGDLHGKRF